MIEINGKKYPLWSQFVEMKEEWIGGILEDFGDSFDIRMGFKRASGTIKDIRLTPNGKDSAFFSIDVEEGWGCGFDVSCGGVSGDQNDETGWINFRGYGGHKWRIKKKE